MLYQVRRQLISIALGSVAVPSVMAGAFMLFNSGQEPQTAALTEDLNLPEPATIETTANPVPPVTRTVAVVEPEEDISSQAPLIIIREEQPVADEAPDMANQPIDLAALIAPLPQIDETVEPVPDIQNETSRLLALQAAEETLIPFGDPIEVTNITVASVQNTTAPIALGPVIQDVTEELYPMQFGVTVTPERIDSAFALTTFTEAGLPGLLMGYAPVDMNDPALSVGAEMIDMMLRGAEDIEEAAPDLSTSIILPTREATSVEESCRGSRWTVINSAGEIVADSESRATIACPMASLTKVMTLYLAMKAIEENPEFSVETLARIPNDWAAKRYAQTGVRPVTTFGQRRSIGYLMAAAGRASDAPATIGLAIATARALGYQGDTDELYNDFIAEMNEAAKDLGLSSTQFSNAVGFTDGLAANFADAVNVSTAEDMARLLQATYELNPTLTARSLGADGFYNINHTVPQVRGIADSQYWADGADFGKSGTTTAAGSAGVVSFEVDGERFYLSILGARHSSHRTTVMDIARGQLVDVMRVAAVMSPTPRPR